MQAVTPIPRILGVAALRPGLETVPWGERQVRIQAPFHNRLVFVSPTGEGA